MAASCKYCKFATKVVTGMWETCYDTLRTKNLISFSNNMILHNNTSLSLASKKCPHVLAKYIAAVFCDNNHWIYSPVSIVYITN
uniref:Uncharacterized protein n=1 Tax=Arundo donax TaxID=35708 RepID=A0A0A8YSP7_ARUDO